MLQGRVAFVTGAGSGIGRASATAMARSGAHVAVTDLDGAKAARVADDLLEEGCQVTSLALDVLDDEALAAAIEKTASDLGRLDVLHSHAGYQIEGNLEQVSLEDMDMSWRLNVRAHFVAARAAVGPMKTQGGGSIIITSSNSGVQYDREMIAYATTKHAIVAMTRQMAADYAKYKVRFNSLCPGFIDTPFNAGFEKQMGGRSNLEGYVAENVPMGRWGTSDEIADSVLFLASDMSSFMTGHALVIDGGECI
ncbi:SDR family NAD(P)-dependent oxidoreductase [Pseudohalocynthiibacter aestuariivivens]|uniref:SDR family NAD(P)-dependent oxidoreductase n=1 Tax=Pseudohalocynthiibacter aestuariivivens TaxID=1591409 RepID=A0ABV5JH04_9RHOB|nr:MULTISPECIES: SDR family oxidoreductase [Pseudohalocynthiibacter]MBS9718435.1 SDR family oxidoreductase [Pseudohalocynthiibacter aestuariivivens]MCK0104098.1 SDR family oxidoreductase [Pseudohalocynthiibacter sp. F2068]